MFKQLLQAGAMTSDEVLRAGLGMTPDGPYCDYFAAVKRQEFLDHHHKATRSEVDQYLTLM